jgi:hypothetical protein
MFKRIKKNKVVEGIMLFFLLVCIMSYAVVPASTVPSFLEKTPHGYKEKPIILVTKKINNKLLVISAYFPDGKCVKYPGSTILALPHRFMFAPDKTWTSCSPFDKEK